MFQEEDVTLDILQQLTEDQLRQIGIRTLGQRIRILNTAQTIVRIEEEEIIEENDNVENGEERRLGEDEENDNVENEENVEGENEDELIDEGSGQGDNGNIEEGREPTDDDERR